MFFGRGQDTMDYALLLQEKQKSEKRLFDRITALEEKLKIAVEALERLAGNELGGPLREIAHEALEKIRGKE